jgi:hypothetical protein
MKIITFHKPLPIPDPESFLDLTGENMEQAHSLVESGKTVGKIALAGF